MVKTPGKKGDSATEMEEQEFKFSQNGSLYSAERKISLPIVALSAALVVAVSGLVVFLVVRHTPMLDSLTLISHLLAAGLFGFGVGVGGFGILFNLFYTPILTVRRAAKVGLVYMVYLSVLTLVVNGGTFNPRIAVLSIALLGLWALMYGVVYAAR